MVRDRKGEEQISTFAPGMIIKISSDSFSKFKFKRLFAPTSSHTISKNSRTCESCHLNPVALGYGKGKFKFKKENGKNQSGF